ncbi:hypothetical protein NDN08_002036 [Rhodosorus marinus]|uniref:Serine/threonine-protein kinase ATR n=1 Tax=Rhodosorus marinus TaxID=101924 RepID=A0AAV8UU15_9RHOD|nr:hypothetical protein NDN08_002036 [Rhodosorus marinus]
MEDGKLVITALRKVLALLRKGEHVEEALQGLAGVQQAARDFPSQLKSTGPVLPELYDSAINTLTEERAVRSCIDTLVAIASALSYVQAEAYNVERIVTMAASLLSSERDDADDKLWKVEYLISQFLNTARTWFMCRSDIRRDLLKCCLRSISSSKSSEKLLGRALLLKALVRVEVTLQPGGIGVYLGEIVAKLKSQFTKSNNKRALSCACTLISVMEDLCVHDFSDGLAALATVFSSSTGSGGLFIGTEQIAEVSELRRGISSCMIAICVHARDSTEKMRALNFCLETVRLHYLPIMGNVKDINFLSPLSTALNESHGVLKPKVAVESYLAVALHRELQVCAQSVEDICRPPSSVTLNLQERANSLLSLGSCLTKLDSPLPFPVGDLYRESTAVVLLRLSGSLGTNGDPKVVKDTCLMLLSLCDVLCQFSGENTAVHVIVEALIAVFNSGNDFQARKVSTVVRRLVPPKSPDDAERLIHLAESALGHAGESRNLDLLACGVHILKTVAASDNEQEREIVPELIRKNMATACALMDDNTSFDLDPTTLSCFANILCASSLCPALIGGGNCRGGCPFDIWQALYQRVEVAAHNFVQPKGLIYLHGAGKLTIHADPMTVSTLSSLAHAALENLWSINSTIRKSAAASADSILPLSRRISFSAGKQDGMMIGTEESTDTVVSERESLLWSFVERLRSASELAPLEAYVDALRYLCMLTEPRELHAIAFDLLLSEVVLDIKDPAGRSMSAYEALANVAKKSSTKKKSAAAIAETLRLAFPQVLPLFVHRMLADDDEIADIFSTLADLDISEFWSDVPRYVLPSLVRTADDESINGLAKRLEKSAEEVIRQNLPSCLAKSLLSRGTKARRLLESFTKSSLSELIDENESEITKTLVWELGGSQNDRALRALESIAGQESLKDLLSRNFLRVVDSLNVRLFASKVKADRPRALRAMNHMFPLCAGEVHLFIPKVMATLKLAIEVEDTKVKDEAQQAWATFLGCLTPKQAGPNLISIMEILLPRFSTVGDDIIKSIQGFVEGTLQGDENGDQIAELHLLLDEFTATKREYFATIFSTTPARKFTIQWLTSKATGHENSKLRQAALGSLRRQLIEHRTSIMSDPYLPTLINKVLKSLSFRDEKYRQICVEVLAEIGAPDPQTINNESSPMLRAQRQQIGTSVPESSADLARVLLCKYLVPILRRGESRGGGDQQNQAGFSIQEILRMHGCTPMTPSLAELSDSSMMMSTAAEVEDDMQQADARPRDGVAFWRSLPENIRASVKPYLEANFETTFRNGGGRELSQRLSDRLRIMKPGMKTSAWVKEFTARIIDALGNQDTAGTAEVLIASRVVIRNDYGTGFFCLPHAIAALVEDSNSEEVVKSIAAELLEALKHDRESIQVTFSVVDTIQSICDLKSDANVLRQKKAGLRPEAKETLLDSLSPASEATFLPRNRLAQAAKAVSASARVVLYMEESRRGQRSDTHISASEVRLLEEAYADLEDLDDLIGVASLRESQTVEEKILKAESLGNFDDQLTYLEQLLSIDPNDINANGRYLQCLKLLGHWESMLVHSRWLMQNCASHDVAREIAPFASEAARRLSRWDVLEEVHSRSFTLRQNAVPWEAKYEKHLGEMFLGFRRHEESLVIRGFNDAVKTLTQPLASASLVGYRQAADLLSKAHCALVVLDSAKGEHEPLLACVDDRIEAMSPSLRFREPVLACRIASLQLLGKRYEAGEMFIKLAKLARKSGNPGAAMAASNRALSMGAENAVVEIAKLQFIKGHKRDAINMLSKEIIRSEECLSENDGDAKSRLATLRLRLGRWSEITKSTAPSEILDNYRNAAFLAPDSEKPSYMLGRYFDVLLTETLQAPIEKPGSLLPAGARAQPMLPAEFSAREGTASSAFEYLPYILENWSNSLHLSVRYIHQVLPRMLTLWFSFYELTNGEVSAAARPSHELQKKVRQGMKEVVEKLPKSVWLTTMPQLLSRLLHPSEQVVQVLMDLLASLVAAYPDQALWYVVPVTRSADSERAARARSIVKSAVSLAKSKRATEVLGAGGTLVKELIRVCIQGAPQRTRMIKASSALKGLLRLFPSPVAIPTQKALSCQPESFVDGDSHVRFQGVDEEVVLMPSLMKPKKVSFRGSDGRKYVFLCKREDSGDMRKDARLMDFARVVNRLLNKDSQSKQRSLSLRTYEVLPLNEECGLVEWVDNLVSIRAAYLNMYRSKGFTTSFQEIIKAKEVKTCSDVEFFDEFVTPLFPVMLHSFFVRKYRDPSTWLEARRRFTRSVAVWSMTGYIVGLGDRHGENITIEMSTGTCVHVDFACMFDKGLTLKVPELVPFRLTRNLIDAMGIHAPEGAFRRVSEMSLACLRQNKETLMSVLETFLHDPLVEWNTSSLSKGKASSSKPNAKNAYAVRTLRAVEMKLEGIVGSGLALSIEGQVQRLIHEATSSENLSKMYAGWMAWV